MAVSPPFNLAETVPADDDFAAQFPGVERTFRDTVESWLLTEGNVQGRSAKRSFDWQGSSPSGTASVTTTFADVLGYMLQRFGTNNVQYLGVPPGTIVFTGGSSADEGYLHCDGSAVSRTTYARLFARIGTTFGAGDTTTTFNLPDVRGRVLAGYDAGAATGRLTSGGAGINSSVMGAAGGAQTVSLNITHIASFTPTGTITGTPSGTISGFNLASRDVLQGSLSGINCAVTASQATAFNSTMYQAGSGSVSVPLAGQTTLTMDALGGNQAHTNQPPTIVAFAQIKY